MSTDNLITKDDIGKYMTMENKGATEKRGHFIVGRLVEIYKDRYVIVDEEGMKHESDKVEDSANVLFKMRKYIKTLIEENQKMKKEYKEIITSYRTGIEEYYDSIELLVEKNSNAYQKLITNLVNQLKELQSNE